MKIIMDVKQGLLFICLAGCGMFAGCSKTNVTIESPDHELAVRFDLSPKNAGAQYCIYYEKRKVIDNSSMGLVLKNGDSLGQDVTIRGVKRSSFSGSWKPVYGQRDDYPDYYNQAVITLKDRKTGTPSLIITFRCYNEGVAFRYTVPGADSLQKTMIAKELTEYCFPGSVNAWASHSAQGKISEIPVDSMDGVFERPLLVEEDTATWLALGEAALVDFARMKFVRSKRNKHALVASLDGSVEKHGTFSSPWRYIMAAQKPGELLEHNYLVLNLNEPDRLKNTGWIKPGKVLREVTLTTQGAIACIDFAEKHHLQYILFDAGWYGAENSDTSDARRVAVDPARSKGPLDLQKIIHYGESKGIGVILYVNHVALERQLDTLLPLYESWGIKGVKYGFVNVGTQKANTWLMAAVRKAARYHLMVDIHDEYRPTGYSRTYPNLMTQEGVRGDETRPPNDMVLNTLFTRMIAGAADQTNCYFAPGVSAMGSHASQLAKSICIYSPFQCLFWYDRPEGSPLHKGGGGGVEPVIRETPELQFFDRLPTVWDDTRVLGGYPGRYIAIARKKGSDWFIGCITGKKHREFRIDLSFLTKGVQYNAVIYDDDPSVQTLTKVGIKKMIVDSKSILKRNVLSENGLAVYLSPKY
jgi:alpha-glucosidase